MAVRTAQPIRLVADASSDWYFRTNGGAYSSFALAKTVAVWTVPSSLSRRFTFDRLEVAIVTAGGAAPTGAGTLFLNLVEGPVSVLHATSQIRNEAREEPPLHPDMLENDDPPLGLPLAMPGANRDGMGTVLLERAREPGGAANLVSLYGPGMFLESSGRLGVRTPIGVQRGLGPFQGPIAHYHHGGFYFNYDFGKSRTLSITRFLREDFGLDKDVIVLRGDGRRNTYRYFNFHSGSGVTYFTPAASLRNTLYKKASFFQETTPSGTYYLYNAGGSLPGRLERVIDRYNNTVYYRYNAFNRLHMVEGLSTSGLSAYLGYDTSGRCNMFMLNDTATPGSNRTSYFEYNADSNLIKITGPESCVTYFEYGTGSPTIEFLTGVTDSLNQRWVAGYDASSRVTKIVDPKGQTAYFNYDTTAPLTEWKDRAGRKTYFEYGPWGSVTSVRQVGVPGATPIDYFRYDVGDGSLTSSQNRLANNWYFQYDSRGSRISATDPLLARSYFAYDASYQLVSYTDPLLHQTYLAYDAKRNRVLQIDPIGRTSYFAYQASGLLFHKKDRRGAFTYFGFDGKANLTAVRDQFAATTYHNYNGAGDRTQTIDPLSRFSYFIYDKRGRVTQSSNPMAEVRYFAYDVACNVVAEVDPRATTTYHVYDANYNRIKTSVPMGGGVHLFTYFNFDEEDRPSSRKDARLNATSWSYDGLGRRQNQTDPYSNVRYWGYDAAHEVLLTLDENRNATYYDYDVTGRLFHTVDANLNAEYYGYDVCGNRVKVTDKRGNSTTFTYDARDLLQNTTNAIGAVTYNAYDAEQNRIMTLDALKNPAYFNYDLRGQLVETRDAFGSLRYLAYDQARQQTMQLEPPLNESTILAPTYYAYDLAGRRQSVTDAYLKQSYMAYDRGGNLILTTNPRYSKEPTAFAYFKYDAASRQIETVDTGELATYHVFDLVGNRVAVLQEQGFGRQPWGTSPYGGERVATYMEYDNLNRSSVALSASSLYSQNVALTYHGYDKASNRIFMEVDNPKGGTDKRCSYWVYDRLNRVTRVQDPPAATGATAGFMYYVYDENSNRTVVDDQEFRRTYFDYDALNRQSKQKNAFLDTTYLVYDVRNSLTRRIDAVGRATYYDFDSLSRTVRQSNALGQVSYFGYDKRSNRVLSQNPRGFSTYFSYDLLGRLSQQKDALANFRYFGYDEVGNKVLEVDERFGWTYFAYDQANRTRMVMDQGDSSVPVVRGQTYFGWDARGLMRMKTDADGRLTSFGYFGYDASRRPTTEMHDTDPWLYYTYDSVGNLTQIVDETGTFGQTFDKLNRLTTKQTKADTVYYFYDKSGMKAQVSQPTSPGFYGSYYSYDAAGRLFYVAPFSGPGGNVRPAYYVYDAAGLMTKKILFGNNVMTYFVYDSASRLQQMANLDSTAATITYLGYARDANGNNTSTAREGGMTIYYAYDALDRLTQESWKSSAGTTIYGFYYNYDAASNRYFQYDYRGAPVTTYWTYDARNVLTQETTLP